MAFERFSGMSPVGLSLIPAGYVLPERAWMNPPGTNLEDGFVPEDVDDESFLVPTGRIGNVLVRLHGIPYGNLLDGDVFSVWTGLGKTGTELTVTLTYQTLSLNEVWVMPGSGWAALPASMGGTTVYFNYKTVFSGFDMTDAAYLWESVRRLQVGESVGVTAEAGEDIEDQFVYVKDSDGKCYVADPSSHATIATGFVRGEVLTGSTATIQKGGTAEPESASWTLPVGVLLHAGVDGAPTYDGDAGAAALVSGNYAKEIGRSYDGSTIVLGDMEAGARYVVT